MQGGAQSSSTGQFGCRKLRWDFDISGGWGSEGLVRKIGTGWDRAWEGCVYE